MTEGLLEFWAVWAADFPEGPGIAGKTFEGPIRVGDRLIVPESSGASPFVKTVFGYGAELDFAEVDMGIVLVVDGFDVDSLLPDSKLYFEDGEAAKPSRAAEARSRIVQWMALTRADPTMSRQNLLELAVDESLPDVCARYVGGALAQFVWAGMSAPLDTSSWAKEVRAAFVGTSDMSDNDKSMARVWGDCWWESQSLEPDPFYDAPKYFPEPGAKVMASDLAGLVAADPTEGRAQLLHKMATLYRDEVGWERKLFSPLVARMYWAGAIDPGIEKIWPDQTAEQYRAMMPQTALH